MQAWTLSFSSKNGTACTHCVWLDNHVHVIQDCEEAFVGAELARHCLQGLNADPVRTTAASTHPLVGAAGAVTRQPRNSKRAHFRFPALQTPPKFHEKTSRETEKERRAKKAQNFESPTLSCFHLSRPHLGASLNIPTSLLPPSSSHNSNKPHSPGPLVSVVYLFVLLLLFFVLLLLFMLLNGYIVLKEQSLLDGLTLANFFRRFSLEKCVFFHVQ